MRPNFLIFITDQHRARDLGCYGNAIVQTPHIDALAAGGLTMDRAYVASPACMPNRASLLTSRLPSLHGAKSNGVALSVDAVTFPELLAAAGYRTALIGKSHLQNFTGRKALVERESQGADHVDPPAHLSEARHRADGDYEQEDQRRWEQDPQFDISTPFYGFDHVDLLVGHADEVDGHYGRWLRARAPALNDARRGPPDRRGQGLELVQSWETPLPEDLYPTNYVADRAIEYLEARAKDRAQSDESPFLLYCSFPDPHHPFTPPGRYRDMYRPEDMPLPASWEQSTDAPPPHVAWLHAQRDAGKAVKHTPALYACTAREAREATALTYGMISLVDDAIGRVMNALQRTGADRDTVVIFTTDHGDYLGDHQLMLKGPIHYDSLIRVPLIWADPQMSQGGRRSAALCSTIDIAASILDRAKVASSNGMQGHSFLPLLRDEAAAQSSVLIEDEVQRTFLGFTRPVRMRTLVTGQYRLSLYLDSEWGELYDLAHDPLEMRNLWSEPGHRHVRGELVEALALKMIEAADKSRLPTHLA